MSAELFSEYSGYSEKDGFVAAAVVEKEQIKKLSQFTGGVAVGRTVRGGSVVLQEIILNGATAKFGDYIVALDGGVFLVMKKDKFEAKFKYRGPLRTSLF